MTFNDLERLNGPYFALIQRIQYGSFRGALRKRVSLRIRCRKKGLRSLSRLLMSFWLTTATSAIAVP